MKERPIIFSAQMVRAILEGRKSQTRRIVKPQPDKLPIRIQEAGHAIWHEGKFHFRKNDGTLIGAWEKKCPYGQPGTRLWVRETFWKNIHDGSIITESPDPKYKIWWEKKPSIHMPRSASRILLEVLDVRVERLHEISEQDAIAEGVEQWPDGNWKAYGKYAGKYSDARNSFWSLWNSINGENADIANPWVWVITFRRLESNSIPTI